MYWNEYKTKSECKKITNEYKYFLEYNFVRVTRLFLVYLKMNNNKKWYKARRYYLPNGSIKKYNIIINGKNVYAHPIDFDIKPFELMRKLTTGQGKGYTTEFLLDCHYIKDNYILIAVDLSWQKELDAEPKAIQHIGFIRKIKNANRTNADGAQSIFIVTI